jgi:catechol 2,3-dioxygenase-like lactoylglutathione lyase family enzyme
VTKGALAAIEFVVPDLEASINFLCDIIGFELVNRFRHEIYDAEVAICQTGNIAISLLCPTETGEKEPYQLPTPRLSQLTFFVEDDAALDAIKTNLSKSGVATANHSERAFSISQQAVSSVFGQAPIFIFMLPA